MEHKIILKCRVCLDEFEEEKMFELFKDTKSNYNDVAVLQLYEKVEYCCGVKIRESSEMPSKICLKCYDLTRIWYNFRQLCVNSQVYLESLCTDSHRSNGDDVDSEEYLSFLFEDLQSFRMAARKENDALHVNGHNPESASDKEDDSDSDDEQYEDLPIIEDESDAELEDIIHNIKREQEATDRQKAKDQVVENEVDRTTCKKRSRISVKKVTKLQKRAFRPPSPASYMCSVCGNVYSKKSSFTYHMSLHTNVKAHECELCGKSFRQTCELKNHMRRHTGERPYKCSFCDRCFIDRSEKHRHERVHTNTRPYVCNVCGKSFMYSAILKNHSKLHSGEKDFNCLVCQKAFTLQHQLKAHLQTITHKQKEAQFVGAGYEVVYE